MFGQKHWTCQAYKQKMIRRKQIGNEDNLTLMEYYYIISDCTVALGQLKLTTTHLIYLALKCFDKWFINRLQSFMANWQNFPSLWKEERKQHLWILRIGFETAFKEAYLPVKHELKKNWDSEEKYVGTTLKSNKCILCDNQPKFFKCNEYRSLDPADQLSLAEEKNLCLNYLKSGYQTVLQITKPLFPTRFFKKISHYSAWCLSESTCRRAWGWFKYNSWYANTQKQWSLSPD